MYVPRNNAVLGRELLSGNELRTVQRHKAYHVTGFTFAWAAGPAVWRGELSLYIDREHQTTQQAGGIERAEQMNPGDLFDGPCHGFGDQRRAAKGRTGLNEEGDIRVVLFQVKDFEDVLHGLAGVAMGVLYGPQRR